MADLLFHRSLFSCKDKTLKNVYESINQINHHSLRPDVERVALLLHKTASSFYYYNIQHAHFIPIVGVGKERPTLLIDPW